MKRNLRYTRDDMEISMSNLFFHVLKKWKSILLITLIGVALGVAFQNMRVSGGALLPEQREYERKVQEYEYGIASNQEIIESTGKLVEVSQDAQKNSIYLNLDSEHVWMSTVVYAVHIDNADLSAYSNMSINPYTQIADSYNAQLQGNLIPEADRMELIGSDILGYWNELVRISNSSTGTSITFTAYGPDEAFVTRITDYLEKRLMEQQEKVGQSLAPHSLSRYSANVSETRNTAVAEAAAELADKIARYQEKIVKAQTDLDTLLDQDMPVAPGKHILKIGALFGIIFALLAVTVIVICYLASGRVLSRSFAILYDAPVLGRVRSASRRRLWIDRKIEDWQYRHFPDADREMDTIAAYLKANAGEGRVCVCGMAPDADVEAFVKAMNGRTGSAPALVRTDDILQNADRIREARASQGLVIVEKVGASRLNAVFDEADKLVAADVPVLGWVVIE